MTNREHTAEDQMEILRQEVVDLQKDAEQNQAEMVEAMLIIERQRRELSTLNRVIAGRKFGHAKVRRALNAVYALHSPIPYNADKTVAGCEECGGEWPCRTIDAARAIKVEYAQEDTQTT